MPVLNDTDAVYVGDVPAVAVYAGTTLVWSAVTESWGPQERTLSDTPPTQGTGGHYTFGARFDVLAPGRITHIRYWSQDATQTNHVLSIWDESSRGKLATVTDPGPGAGWREVALAVPLLVDPDTYVVSRYEPVDFNYDLTTSESPSSPNLGPPRALYVPGDAGGEAFPYTDAGAGVTYYIDVVYQALM